LIVWSVAWMGFPLLKNYPDSFFPFLSLGRLGFWDWSAISFFFFFQGGGIESFPTRRECSHGVATLPLLLFSPFSTKKSAGVSSPPFSLHWTEFQDFQTPSGKVADLLSLPPSSTPKKIAFVLFPFIFQRWSWSHVFPRCLRESAPPITLCAKNI